MANIKVNELNPAGTQLFSDAENFLNELSHDELDAINGGLNNECECTNERGNTGCCFECSVAC